MEQEIWKDVVGYEGFYSISNLGNVRRDEKESGTHPGKILKLNICKGRRYYIVVLCKNKVKKNHFVHRLVAEAFIGERPYKYTVNHIDCNKTNNTPINLEYITTEENTRHAHRNGLIKYSKGIQRPNAKLNEEDVINIREMYKNGIKQKDIANKYNISDVQIYRIIEKQNWKHI